MHVEFPGLSFLCFFCLFFLFLHTLGRNEALTPSKIFLTLFLFTDRWRPEPETFGGQFEMSFQRWCFEQIQPFWGIDTLACTYASECMLSSQNEDKYGMMREPHSSEICSLHFYST